MKAVIALFCALAVNQAVFADENSLLNKRVYADQSVTLKVLDAIVGLIGGEALPLIAATDGKTVSYFFVEISDRSYERFDLNLETSEVSEFLCLPKGASVLAKRQIAKNLITQAETSEKLDVIYNGKVNVTLAKLSAPKIEELSARLQSFRRRCSFDKIETLGE